MRHISPFDNRTRRRLAALAACVVFTIVAFLFLHSSTTAVASYPQKRRPQPRRPTSTQAAKRAAARSKSRFLHDENHVKFDATRTSSNCSECHSIDEPWQYVVKDFPDHDKCLRCHEAHRPDFFNGARPSICTVCHKSSSPREVRPRPFPKPNNEVTESFPGYFPHGLHQDVIALSRPTQLPETWTLLRASFWPQDDKPRVSELESCATCHDLNKQPGFFPIPVTDPSKRWPEGMREEKEETKDGKKTVSPGGTFRSLPEGWDGHKTCFVCHGSTKTPWASQKPVANDCAGCHLSRGQGEASNMLQLPPGGGGRVAARTTQPQKFTFTTADLPNRTVFKFQHEVKDHDIACTTCHINITQQTTLNLARPDVPIASCAVCHLTGNIWTRKVDGKDEKITINSELAAYQKTGDAKQCVGCHTSEEASRKPIPCDHINVLKPADRFTVKCTP